MRKSAIILGVLIALALTGCETGTEPTAVQPAEKGGKKATSKGKPVPIKLAAKPATAKASILSDGKALSCTRVTVTNQSKKNLEVNPLYFSITDTGGTKHDPTEALADYEGQISTTTLAPAEKATGLVCARGKFKPKVVAFTDPLFSEAARAQVG
ncbi:DUF4352 domain-containing protein [Spirillospora sp. CA-294931]|uniref:DUF4352 domain-containing protein n=1 Tax=Spirillospora sp. CA-294931 TaxID=3240042 RepID=UPI003D8C7A50